MRKTSKILTLACISSILVVIFTVENSLGIDPKDIVRMWLFDDESNPAKDSSSNKLDGEIKGTPKLDDGKFGEALELNGSSDHINCGNDATLNITDEITVVGWMKTTTIARWNVIAAQEIWDSKAGWILYISTDTKPAFSISSTIIKGPTSVATDEWYHLAGVADSSGNVKLYLNGEQEGSGNSKLTHADIDLLIGTRHPNAGGAGIKDPFPGLIDEVAIFNVALSEEDIKRIMNEGLEVVTGIIAVSPAGKLATTWASIKKQ